MLLRTPIQNYFRPTSRPTSRQVCVKTLADKQAQNSYQNKTKLTVTMITKCRVGFTRHHLLNSLLFPDRDDYSQIRWEESLAAPPTRFNMFCAEALNVSTDNYRSFLEMPRHTRRLMLALLTVGTNGQQASSSHGTMGLAHYIQLLSTSLVSAFVSLLNSDDAERWHVLFRTCHDELVH